MDKQALEKFEKDLLTEAQNFLNKYLEVPTENPEFIFHYTDRAAKEAILKGSVMWASHIRSTSDPLEFALGMSGCRDWFCFDSKIFTFQNYPSAFFKDLTLQAANPSLIPYFISATDKDDSKHLINMYGPEVIRIKLPKTFKNSNAKLNLIRVKYVDDPYSEAKALLNIWREEFLSPLISEHKVTLLDPKTGFTYWYPTIMQIFFSVSLYLKKKGFEKEEEQKLLIFTADPDIETKEHQHRQTRPLGTGSKLNREYLPIKVNGLDITVSEK